LIVYAPLLALFIFFISKKSQLVILAIGSGFFWLISILVASMFWFSIPPLKGIYPFVIPCTVLFQELFRWIFYKIYTKAEIAFVKTAQLSTSPISALHSSVATGWGIAVAYALVMYVGVLWEGHGPGALFQPSCPSVSVFVISAFYCLCFVLLHICFSIIAFLGFRTHSYSKIAFVVGSHLLASGFSLIKVCGVGITLDYIVLLVSVVVCFRTSLARRIPEANSYAMLVTPQVDEKTPVLEDY